MSDSLVIHKRTQHSIDAVIEQPPHALIVLGRRGMGKATIARHLIANLLQLDLDKIDSHAAVSIIEEAGTSISIDSIRDVQHFLSRKSTSHNALNRIVLLPDAQRLTTEAQNALLKTLEEPPAGSMIIMTAVDEHSLLPTVVSRSQLINIVPPTTDQIHDFFGAEHERAVIERSVLMSGGLPGLISELLHADQQHPLIKAADLARDILRLDTFGRLALVDSLSKQRDTCLQIVFLLQQMADLTLQRSKTAKAQKQWRTIMQQAYVAEQALNVQAQPKLVMTNLMLAL